jgi:glycosyltransferase involved in cell wall biosynthesis
VVNLDAGSEEIPRHPRLRCVVHLLSELKVGGLEKVVLDLVRSRARDTFDARVICLDAGGVLAREYAEAGVKVETIGRSGTVPQRIGRLVRRLRQLAPDIVHTHNPQAHLHGSWAAKLAGVPVIVHTKHGRGVPTGLLIRTASRVATAWTTRYVAVSGDAALVAMNLESVPSSKLQVIHNGIDVERFAERAGRAQLSNRAVTVGRLDPIKDHATLLRAVRLVIDKIPDFQLDVVGEGECLAELEALQSALGLGGHVHFRGHCDDIRPYLFSADFFVLSSISEGVPLALLEAMACGLPAVATDVGGIREVIVPGESGHLVPARSPEILAQAMLTVQGDGRVAELMGRAARRRVEEHFNLRRVVAAYEQMYLTCLDQRILKAGRS